MSEETTELLETQEETLDSQNGNAEADKQQDSGNADTDKQQDDLPKGVKRTINRMTRQTREAQEEARALARKVEELERLISNNATPTEELSEKEQIIREAERRLEERQKKRQEHIRASEEQQQKALKIKEGLDEIAKEDPEIIDLLEDASNIFLPQEAAEFIQDSDYSARILAHLAKNPEEAQSLAKKTPAQIDRYLSRIEAKIELALESKTTAPKKDGAKETPQSKPNDPAYRKSPSDMSTKEWMEWRRGEEAKKRKR